MFIEVFEEGIISKNFHWDNILIRPTIDFFYKIGKKIFSIIIKSKILLIGIIFYE